MVKFKLSESQLLKKFDKSLVLNIQYLFQFIQGLDQLTGHLKFCKKQVKLFYIYNLMKKTIQKDCNHIHMIDLIIILESYCKKAFITYEFDNYQKRFNIINFFFLFIFVSYLLCFVLQNIPKPTFISLKYYFSVMMLILFKQLISS